jgi:hypothetical protein
MIGGNFIPLLVWRMLFLCAVRTTEVNQGSVGGVINYS